MIRMSSTIIKRLRTWPSDTRHLGNDNTICEPRPGALREALERVVIETVNAWNKNEIAVSDRDGADQPGDGDNDNNSRGGDNVNNRVDGADDDDRSTANVSQVGWGGGNGPEDDGARVDAGNGGPVDGQHDNILATDLSTGQKDGDCTDADAPDNRRAGHRRQQNESLVVAAIDAIDAYLGTPEARALCPVTTCLCGRNFETLVRDILSDIVN